MVLHGSSRWLLARGVHDLCAWQRNKRRRVDSAIVRRTKWRNERATATAVRNGMNADSPARTTSQPEHSWHFPARPVARADIHKSCMCSAASQEQRESAPRGRATARSSSRRDGARSQISQQVIRCRRTARAGHLTAIHRGGIRCISCSATHRQCRPGAGTSSHSVRLQRPSAVVFLAR